MTTNSKATLYLDVDGVINFLGSRNQYTKHMDLGYLKKTSVPGHHPTYGYGVFTMNWSAELLRKLSEVDGLEIALLSSWNDSAESLFRGLDWKTDRVMPSVFGDNPFTEENKFDLLLKEQSHNPKPFIWADDTATLQAVDYDFGIENLILTPDDKFGLTRDDLNSIIEFVENLD